jgi:hypothetical protein
MFGEMSVNVSADSFFALIDIDNQFVLSLHCDAKAQCNE